MRNNLETFHVVIFPPVSTEQILRFLQVVPTALENITGFKVEIGYTHLEKKPAKSQGIF